MTDSLQDAVGPLTELLESADIPWALEQGELTGKSNRWVRIDDDRELTVFYKYGVGSVADCNKDEARARLIVEAINALPSLLSALVEMRWKNEALGRALGPFANAYRDNMLHVVVEYHYDLSGPTSRILTPSEFKAARQALRQKESAK